ncbi:MAG: hypothetical protein ACREBD_02625 [Blastocatellia bacterium]
MSPSKLDRRTWLRGCLGAAAMFGLDAALPRRTNAALLGQKEQIKVTKI